MFIFKKKDVKALPILIWKSVPLFCSWGLAAWACNAIDRYHGLKKTTHKAQVGMKGWTCLYDHQEKSQWATIPILQDDCSSG